MRAGGFFLAQYASTIIFRITQLVSNSPNKDCHPSSRDENNQISPYEKGLVAKISQEADVMTDRLLFKGNLDTNIPVAFLLVYLAERQSAYEISCYREDPSDNRSAGQKGYPLHYDNPDFLPCPDG